MGNKNNGNGQSLGYLGNTVDWLSIENDHLIDDARGCLICLVNLLLRTINN